MYVFVRSLRPIRAFLELLAFETLDKRSVRLKYDAFLCQAYLRVKTL
jgi:hypothetical protein